MGISAINATVSAPGDVVMSMARFADVTESVWSRPTFDESVLLFMHRGSRGRVLVGVVFLNYMVLFFLRGGSRGRVLSSAGFFELRAWCHGLCILLRDQNYSCRGVVWLVGLVVVIVVIVAVIVQIVERLL